ncbi:uncharacterized protein EV422DRAFT_323618 [Fimicolochytrium jonesii]|uniref:uncharacterized protein n=1 Tax=Fimicolochytrium jonesii TaxID=1396493 RepID=UPI0022FF09FA|nr:uncharacterized protein EV422DRAFT_323618 [Fimicolochytrium jonesii]KAI8824521.1 hypothetical protein EV422DRAFT_323618 [Fimicolochytrium jonesii]
MNLQHVECKYGDLEPFAADIVINLSENGICLRFDPVTQLLRLIELYDFSKYVLAYSDVEFNSLHNLPTFVTIYKLFGPIYPGQFDPRLEQYTLTYPGISFLFPVPAKYISQDSIPDLPLSFPDGTTPVLNRFYVFTGADKWRDAVAPLPKSDVGEVIAEIGNGIHMPNRRRGERLSIGFGMPAQDVLDVLGKAEGMRVKNDEQIKIFGADEAAEEEERGDYFWSYFSVGVDILFSAATHCVKKIVLHTNPVGSWDFTQYRKCRFQIKPTEGRTQPITSESMWPDIQRALHPTPAPRPVVHNKGGHQNPFGATCFYGYYGVVFEVVNKTGQLASLTLFEI